MNEISTFCRAQNLSQILHPDVVINPLLAWEVGYACHDHPGPFQHLSSDAPFYRRDLFLQLSLTRLASALRPFPAPARRSGSVGV